MSEAIVMVSYQAAAGKAEVARREITALVSAVLAAEPECHGIEVLQDLSDPARFTLIEQWRSQEAFQGPHMQQPHIQQFIQRAATFLAGPPVISFWRAVDGA